MLQMMTAKRGEYSTRYPFLQAGADQQLEPLLFSQYATKSGQLLARHTQQVSYSPAHPRFADKSVRQISGSPARQPNQTVTELDDNIITCQCLDWFTR